MDKLTVEAFAYEHLPERLQARSIPFHNMATELVEAVPEGVYRQIALAKLLEAKDAIVRAHALAGK